MHFIQLKYTCICVNSHCVKWEKPGNLSSISLVISQLCLPILGLFLSTLKGSSFYPSFIETGCHLYSSCLATCPSHVCLPVLLFPCCLPTCPLSLLSAYVSSSLPPVCLPVLHSPCCLPTCPPPSLQSACLSSFLPAVYLPVFLSPCCLPT
jgi:hypothetical protein